MSSRKASAEYLARSGRAQVAVPIANHFNSLESRAMLYKGECHCGAIGYAYRTEVAPEQWPIRACQCSFCRMHGARTTSDPSGGVEFTFKEVNFLRPYRFGLHTADFLVCGRCGGYLGATTVTQEGSFAVVNVNLLKPYLESLRAAQPMRYEGEAVEERSRRRAQRWTPCQGTAIPELHPLGVPKNPRQGCP